MSQENTPSVHPQPAQTDTGNDVGKDRACPKCSESDADKLILDEEKEDSVTGTSCGTVYTLPPIATGGA